MKVLWKYPKNYTSVEHLDQQNANIPMFFVFLQELDSAYMGKMESDVRVDILRQELEFLRCLYEAVSD